MLGLFEKWPTEPNKERTKPGEQMRLNLDELAKKEVRNWKNRLPSLKNFKNLSASDWVKITAGGFLIGTALYLKKRAIIGDLFDDGGRGLVLRVLRKIRPK